MTARPRSDRSPEKTERFADLLGETTDDRAARNRAAKSVPATRVRPRSRPMAPEPSSSAPARIAGTNAGAGAGAKPGAHESGPRNGPRFRWPDPSEPRLAGAEGINDRLLMRLARGEPEPEERIDLHGTRTAEARRLVARRIESAVARGLRCVAIVHGRGKGSPTGEAALRDGVSRWLTEGQLARHVLAMAPAPNRLGGEGATLVLLRKSARA